MDLPIELLIRVWEHVPISSNVGAHDHDEQCDRAHMENSSPSTAGPRLCLVRGGVLVY